MSSLKINFAKSEVMIINGDTLIMQRYADIFNCHVGVFSIKYLGVPVSPSRLHVADWKCMEEKINKRLGIWQGRSLSIAGRVTLINSSLANSPIYHMSIYLLHKMVMKSIDKMRRTFGKGGVPRESTTL